jgi:hypothetical protein
VTPSTVRTLTRIAWVFAFVWVALIAASAFSACSDGKTARTGLGEGEPIRVTGGQFFTGPLPVGTKGPAVLTTDTRSLLFPQGALGRKISGNAKKGAFAVAMRVDDLGTGFWVVPVGSPDPQTDGDLTYEIPFDVARDAAIGKHKMILSAVDNTGTYGPVTELPIQFAPLIPDGHDVISLEWDVNADLDLVVTTPDGKVVDGKHPSTAPMTDAGVDPTAPGTGVMDHDSNANCVIDGYREESLVWKDPGTPGVYQVRVRLADACGTAGTNFVVTWRRDGEVKWRVTGRVSDLDAPSPTEDGSGPGLYVGSVDL